MSAPLSYGERLAKLDAAFALAEQLAEIDRLFAPPHNVVPLHKQSAEVLAVQERMAARKAVRS